MTQPDKYFIITPTSEEYDTIIRERNLPPGQCFHCIDENEARRGVQINARWGITPIVIRKATT